MNSSGPPADSSSRQLQSENSLINLHGPPSPVLLKDMQTCLCDSERAPLFKTENDNVLDKPQDRSPLIPKQSYGFVYSNDSFRSTPGRLEELKNWLWMKQQEQFGLHSNHCLHLKWVSRSFHFVRTFIHKTTIKKWLKDGKKPKMIMHNAEVQTALSIASLAAALATITAATASNACIDKESKTGIAVASAAALVAAHCADFAETIGADHNAVVESVSTGGAVSSVNDIEQLTALADSSLRSMRRTFKGQREARIHAASSPHNSKVNISSVASLSSLGRNEEEHAECQYMHEILARGSDFLVCFKSGKLHWRYVCIWLDGDKQVIVKLQGRHMAGSVLKSEKRTVSKLLTNIPAWPGRSFLNNGEERSYFGLVTSHGIVEFECESEFDYHTWTTGVSHLLAGKQT